MHDPEASLATDIRACLLCSYFGYGVNVTCQNTLACSSLIRFLVSLKRAHSSPKPQRPIFRFYLAAISIVFLLITFASGLLVWSNFGKGLKKQSTHDSFTHFMRVDGTDAWLNNSGQSRPCQEAGRKHGGQRTQTDRNGGIELHDERHRRAKAEQPNEHRMRLHVPFFPFFSCFTSRSLCTYVSPALAPLLYHDA
jgi:hypothetical protein